MRIFCHVGMQKCGSKAIQNFCRSNDEYLRDIGFTYPDELSKGVWHKDVFTVYNECHAKVLEKLSQRDRDIILSFENAYQAGSEAIKSIAKYSSEVRILILIRRPEDWVNSFLNQIIKANIPGYEVFANFSARSNDVVSKFSFDQHLTRWRNSANVTSIVARAFSTKTDVVTTFLDWLEIPAEKRSNLVFGDENPNKALNGRSARVLLELKKRTENFEHKKRMKILRAAHEKLKSQWIDTTESAGLWLLSSDDEKWIEDNILPSAEGALEKYGPQGEKKKLVKEERGRVLLNFEPNERDLKVVRRILRDVQIV